MINELLMVFEAEIERRNDSLYFLDTGEYRLKEGIYILVKKDGSIEKQILNENTYVGIDENLQRWCKKDFFSNYLESNRSILAGDIKTDKGDKLSGKNIYSSNYLSFFFNLDVFAKALDLDEQLVMSSVTNYYDVLFEKYRVDEVEDIPQNLLEDNKAWVLANIKNIIEEHRSEDDSRPTKKWVKVFFEAPDNEYEKENSRYLMKKFFDTGKDTYIDPVTEEELFVSAYCLNNNAKKPLLQHVTFNNAVASRRTKKEILLERLLFEYLLIQVEKKRRLIYVDMDEKTFIPKEPNEYIEATSGTTLTNGFLLYLEKTTKGVVITDFFRVNSCSSVEFQPLTINFPRKEAVVFDEEWKLKEYVDKYLFDCRLKSNLYGDLSSLKKQPDLKEEVVLVREAAIQWFYKNNPRGFIRLLPKILNMQIERSFKDEQSFRRLKNKIILVDEVIKHYNGGEKLMDKMNTSLQKLEYMLEHGVVESELTEEDFFCAAGQLSYYLLSQKRSNNKKNDEIYYIARASKGDRLIKKIVQLSEAYGYAVNMHNVRFRRLSQIATCNLFNGTKVNKQEFMHGYFADNLLYSKEENIAEVDSDEDNE